MPPIRVGMQITQQTPHLSANPPRLGAWQAVDVSGADILFNWDHFFPLSGDPNRAHLDKRLLSERSGYGRPTQNEDQ